MNKLIGSIASIFVALVVVLALSGSLFETNSKTTYQIKQAAITGKVTVRMTPGTYWQGFGDIDTWAKGDTIYFTKGSDGDGDTNDDQTIEVRFADGAKCPIGVTMRITTPTTKEQAKALVTEHSYTSLEDVKQKLIKPTVRKILRGTANMMTAAQSYKERRADFETYVIDQIKNGRYQTMDQKKEVVDIISGEKKSIIVKVIKRDKSGNPLYHPNPLEGTGITLKNFDIKAFYYPGKVREQIAKQQEAYMAVQTAKANAVRAQQEKITIEEEGKAAVAKAEYAEKEATARQTEAAKREKAVAELAAQKEKAVAELAAQKEKAVALLDKETAALEKDAAVLRAEGQAKAKRLVMQADGALEQKLKALVEIAAFNADALKHRKVPAYMNIGGDAANGGNLDAQTAQFLTTTNAACSVPVRK